MNLTADAITSTVEHNVVSRLKSIVEHHGERVALVIDSAKHGRKQVTFSELWDAVDRTSVGLRHRGLTAEQRAIVMVPMSIELYVVLLAVLKVGAAAVFVDPWIGVRQVAEFAAFAEPTAFIGIGKSHWLRWLERRLRMIRLSVTTGRHVLSLPARYSLAELMANSGDGSVHPVRPNESALITFTSGSSGVPKGANRTHGFLIAQHEALKGEFPYVDAEVDMPMFPVFALNNLATGITSIVPDIDFRNVARCDGARILEQMRREQVTTCTASPPFFDRLVDAYTKDSTARLQLRRILTGGAPVGDDQLRRWRAVWPDMQIEVVYGSTEAEPVAHIGAAERLLRVEQTGGVSGYLLGRAAECIDWRIVRITKGLIRLGAEGWQPWLVDDGEVGELVVTGAHVGKDYYRNVEATLENKIVDIDGDVWHRMGDTVFVDHQRMLWLVGRVHSTIVRRREFVHPQLLELAAHGNDPRIVRLAAVGLTDDTLGEAVAMVVQMTLTPELKSSELEVVANELRQRLRAAGFPVDHVLITRQGLPVDPRHNSKIDYSALRKLIADRKLAVVLNNLPTSIA